MLCLSSCQERSTFCGCTSILSGVRNLVKCEERPTVNPTNRPGMDGWEKCLRTIVVCGVTTPFTYTEQAMAHFYSITMLFDRWDVHLRRCCWRTLPNRYTGQGSIW